MSKIPKKIEATDEAWDTGKLGRDKDHVRVSDRVDEKSIDESVGLVPVSIRLQKSLVNDFKMIAELSGIGYQPLMRQILTRFAECEKKKIIRDMMTEEGLGLDIDHEPDSDGPHLKQA
jgi:predicted DNA binding CopG/RHH family protein